MLYFHWNLLSALLHLKIFAWIYWIGKWQTNEGTNRLTNIVTYRSAIGARVWSQIFFGFYSYRLTNVIVFLEGRRVDVLQEKSFEFYSYRLITFIFLWHANVGSFWTFFGPNDYFWGKGTDQILFWALCMYTNILF